MYQDKVVLCGASAYDKKFYLNEDFERLPQSIKDELKIMCVLFTEDVGGILTLYFDEDGTLFFETRCEDSDGSYDDIGSRLKIGELQRDKSDLLRALELFYKVFVLGETTDALSD